MKIGETYNTAFEITASYVEDKIINQKQVVLLTTLTRYYQVVLQDVGGKSFGDVYPSAQMFEKKLHVFFKDKIKVA